jgi:hypothetical protein
MVPFKILNIGGADRLKIFLGRGIHGGENRSINVTIRDS